MKKFFSLIAAVLFAGSMMAESLLSIDFTQGQGEWTINNVELGGLETVWTQSSSYGMKATGYQDGNHATEAWLVSPAFDLTGVEVATLAFSHARKYGDLSQLSVLAKAGEGEWTALEVSAWPDGSSWSFIEATADLSAFAGQAAVQVAFKYTSTTDGGATWEIKTVSITNEGATPAEVADVVFSSADFNGQGASGTGGNVTATKNGVTFTCDKGFGDQYGVRCYKNSNVSIVSGSEQIGKIVFEFATVSGKTYNGGLNDIIVVNGQEWTNQMADQARMNKISIYFGEAEPVVGPTYDTITVARALEIGKALADKAVSPEKYVITGYVSYIYSFFSKDFNNETVWISDDPENTTTENAFEIYRGKPNTAAEVGWGAKVKIVCQIKNYGGTIENDGVNLPFEVLEASPYVPDTLSIEEAVDIANALGEDAKTPKYHVIKGFIQDAPLPYNYKGSDNKWKNTTIKMSQFPNEQEGPLAVYKANILKADTAKLVQNSYAYVLGYLTKHGGAQVAEGSNVEFVEAPQTDTIHVNVAEAVAEGLKLPMGGKSDRIYAVTGFVNLVMEEFAAGVESFFLADDAASEAQNFFASAASIDKAVEAGAKVEVVGRLQNADGDIITIENGKARYIPGEGIEHIVLTEKAQKVVVDGVIYIVRDNKMFDVRGTQVR